MSASPFVVSRHPSGRVSPNFLIETERPKGGGAGVIGSFERFNT